MRERKEENVFRVLLSTRGARVDRGREMAFLCFSREKYGFGKVLLFNHENSGGGKIFSPQKHSTT